MQKKQILLLELNLDELIEELDSKNKRRDIWNRIETKHRIMQKKIKLKVKFIVIKEKK
jgi:hypothetical protein